MTTLALISGLLNILLALMLWRIFRSYYRLVKEVREIAREMGALRDLP